MLNGRFCFKPCINKKIAPSPALIVKGSGMDVFYKNKILVAVIASLLFMAGVRVAIEMSYPDGTENLSKGKIAVVATPTVVAKR
jgi:hypothetical protein